MPRPSGPWRPMAVPIGAASSSAASTTSSSHAAGADLGKKGVLDSNKCDIWFKGFRQGVLRTIQEKVFDAFKARIGDDDLFEGAKPLYNNQKSFPVIIAMPAQAKTILDKHREIKEQFMWTDPKETGDEAKKVIKVQADRPRLDKLIRLVIGALWKSIETRAKDSLPEGSHLNCSGGGGDLWLEAAGDSDTLFSVKHRATQHDFKIIPHTNNLVKIGIPQEEHHSRITAAKAVIGQQL